MNIYTVLSTRKDPSNSDCIIAKFESQFDTYIIKNPNKDPRLNKKFRI